MRTVRVHGTRPKGHPFPIISWLIRLIEWSDISHVITELEDGRIFHTHFNTAKFQDFEEFKKTNEIKHSYETEIPPENYDQMIDFCMGYEGKKSGYFIKLFGALIPHIMRVFGIYMKNTFAEGMEKSAMCSEYVRYLAVHYWNFTVDRKIHPENFTTMDVLEMMKQNG